MARLSGGATRLGWSSTVQRPSHGDVHELEAHRREHRCGGEDRSDATEQDAENAVLLRQLIEAWFDEARNDLVLPWEDSSTSPTSAR